MKKIVITPENVFKVAGMIRTSLKENNSMLFPERGIKPSNSKLGMLRSFLGMKSIKLTTSLVDISVSSMGIMIINPLNHGFAYGEFLIPCGEVHVVRGAWIWKDKHGYIRVMRFSKKFGWALVRSGGRREIFKMAQ